MPLVLIPKSRSVPRKSCGLTRLIKSAEIQLFDIESAHFNVTICPIRARELLREPKTRSGAER